MFVTLKLKSENWGNYKPTDSNRTKLSLLQCMLQIKVTGESQFGIKLQVAAFQRFSCGVVKHL